MIGMLLKRDRSLFKESFYNASSIIPVNTVIDLNADPQGIIEEKIKFGFSTFKIKTGRKSFNDDLAIIKEIRTRFGYDINLRLDANGNWTPENAGQHLIALEPYKIEYVEEPCRGIENLIKLSFTSPIPVAADESIKSIADAERIVKDSPIQFIIIKPMILGAFFGTVDLISLADSHRKNIIISSAFETALGKSLLVFLASITGHSYAHGLDTAGFLADGLFNDPYPVINGAINFSPDNYPPKFERSGL
jgi:o-succinylbenzoate synthase